MLCPVCGALMVDNKCRYKDSKNEAPWINDYYRMSIGTMSHEEHQVMVARWNLHHQEEISEKVLNWSKNIVQLLTEK